MVVVGIKDPSSSFVVGSISAETVLIIEGSAALAVFKAYTDSGKHMER
ncbi:MAG: hypothetical protein U0Q16_19950 [Bryobacteraceae bacterium]